MADVVKKSNTVIGRERKLGCHGFWYEERERERDMSVLGLLGVFLVMKREILTGGERGERRERK